MGVTAPVLRDSNASYTAGVSEKRGTDTTYLHTGLKNVEAQSDENESFSGAASYDAFGNLISSSGTWQGPFGYAGGFGYQQDTTGYKLLGHRYYDPDAGRFLTRDPAKDGSNWWVYCDNNPVNRFDSGGLRWHYVYQLVHKGGQVMKPGRTSAVNPHTRYTKKFMREQEVEMELVFRSKDKEEAIFVERDLIERFGGPWNRESFSIYRIMDAAANGVGFAAGFVVKGRGNIVMIVVAMIMSANHALGQQTIIWTEETRQDIWNGRLAANGVSADPFAEAAGY